MSCPSPSRSPSGWPLQILNFYIFIHGYCFCFCLCFWLWLGLGLGFWLGSPSIHYITISLMSAFAFTLPIFWLFRTLSNLLSAFLLITYYFFSFLLTLITINLYFYISNAFFFIIIIIIKYSGRAYHVATLFSNYNCNAFFFIIVVKDWRREV